jgi:hypothetical protein
MPKHGALTIEATIPTATSIIIRVTTETLAGERIVTPAANSAYAD